VTHHLTFDGYLSVETNLNACPNVRPPGTLEGRTTCRDIQHHTLTPLTLVSDYSVTGIWVAVMLSVFGGHGHSLLPNNLWLHD
jgi:hypothetical protein